MGGSTISTCDVLGSKTHRRCKSVWGKEVGGGGKQKVRRIHSPHRKRSIKISRSSPSESEMTMSAAPRVAMRMHRHSGRPAQAYGKTSVAEKKELDECLAPGGRNNIVGKEARYLKGVYFSVVPAFACFCVTYALRYYCSNQPVSLFCVTRFFTVRTPVLATTLNDGGVG